MSHSLTEMLKYKRKHGTDSIKDFCQRFLHPTFGYPDNNGNYVLEVGKSKICFASHYDSVHNSDGMQTISIKNDLVSLALPSDSNCLGADCATGMWLMLEMIEAKVEGVYVIHAQEESGCIGSLAMVKSNPKWLDKLDVVISFDRKGKESIITHQMMIRTASDAFAISLDKILGLNQRPDNTGSYTDSNSYQTRVAECTNLSVGYEGQHTKFETQDISFAIELRNALVAANWSELVVERDPSVVQYDYTENWASRYYGSLDYGSRYSSQFDSKMEASRPNSDDFLKLVLGHPEGIALILEDMLGNPYDLVDMLYEYGEEVKLSKRLLSGVDEEYEYWPTAWADK